MATHGKSHARAGASASDGTSSSLLNQTCLVLLNCPLVGLKTTKSRETLHSDEANPQ